MRQFFKRASKFRNFLNTIVNQRRAQILAKSGIGFGRGGGNTGSGGLETPQCGAGMILFSLQGSARLAVLCCAIGFDVGSTSERNVALNTSMRVCVFVCVCVRVCVRVRVCVCVSSHPGIILLSMFSNDFDHGTL